MSAQPEPLPTSAEPTSTATTAEEAMAQAEDAPDAVDESEIRPQESSYAARRVR